MEQLNSTHLNQNNQSKKRLKLFRLRTEGKAVKPNRLQPKLLQPTMYHGVYKKWLQYYLDYCQKYELDPQNNKGLPDFIKKLQDKNQTKSQQTQAEQAITLYYQIVKSTPEQKSGIITNENSKNTESYEVREPGPDKDLKGHPG